MLAAGADIKEMKDKECKYKLSVPFFQHIALTITLF